jgi:MFS superfamily sulfate permease-like transporter
MKKFSEINKFQEFMASLVVFLVALPLCMGIAMASGADPKMGLVSGIIGGLVVGLLAGSPLQVSGPAAGLAVIVADAIHQHGIHQLWAIVLLAGLIQVVSARLALGRWFKAVEPAVIFAMLAGIGVLIFASQFHVMVDDPAPSTNSGMQNLASIPEAVWKGITPTDDKAHHYAALIGIISLACLIVWGQITKRTKSFLRVIPAPLIAVIVATVIAQVFEYPIQYVEVPDKVSNLFTFPTSETMGALYDPAIIGTAFAMAAIASAESLLCASAVDRLHDGEPSDMDKELFAQGVGNTVSGLIGGLPITGVIVRSTANIQAGGQTRWSAVMHGVWLFGLIAFAPETLNLIPRSALAAILVYIGYKLVNPTNIKMLISRGRAEIGIYLITVVCIAWKGLLIGLIIGIALSLLRLAWHFSHVEVRVRQVDGGLDVDLLGAATFMSLPSLQQGLEKIPTDAAVTLHLDHLQYADHACLEYIGEWEKRREDSGGTLEISWDVLEKRVRSPLLRSVTEPKEGADSSAEPA